MKTQTPKPSYVERAAVMNQRAFVEEVEAAQQAFNKAAADTKDGSEKITDGINGFRQTGILLQSLCGHNQMKAAFWLDKLDGKFSFSYRIAQNCIAIANRMPKPAKTIQEAVQHVQQGLFAAGQIELSERTEGQTASPISPIQRFLNEMTLIRQPFQKSIRAQPMEQWESEALDTFLSETEWLAKERERAETLRKSK